MSRVTYPSLQHSERNIAPAVRQVGETAPDSCRLRPHGRLKVIALAWVLTFTTAGGIAGWLFSTGVPSPKPQVIAEAVVRLPTGDAGGSTNRDQIVRVVDSSDAAAIQSAKLIVEQLMASSVRSQSGTPATNPSPAPTATAERLAELREVRGKLKLPADVRGLTLRRAVLLTRTERVRGENEQALSELRSTQSTIKRLSDPSNHLDADLWVRMRVDRLAKSKTHDELYQATLTERTISAKEYWGELGAGKTEEHRDVVLAKRRLTTAETALAKRDAELTATVSAEISLERESSRQRQLEELHVRAASLRGQQSEWNRQLSDLSAASAEIDRNLADAADIQRKMDAFDTEIATLQTASRLSPSAALSAGQSSPDLPRIVQAARIVSRTAQEPVGSSRGWNTAAGSAAGGMLGGSLALLATRRRRRCQAEVKHFSWDLELGARLLGCVPDCVPGDSSAMPATARGLEAALRNVRSELLSLDAPRVVYLTAPVSGTGTSSIVNGLAASYAAAGRRVLVVDANFYHPSLAVRGGLTDEAKGLSDFAAGAADLNECIHPSATQLIDLLPAGQSIAHPSDLLSWPGLTGFIDTLSHDYTQVFVDCPAFLEHAEVLSFAPQDVSCCVCVLDERTAEVTQAAAIRDRFRLARHVPLGLIVNRSNPTVAEAMETAPQLTYDGASSLKRIIPFNHAPSH